MRLYRKLLPYGVAVSSTAVALGLSLLLNDANYRTIGTFFYIAVAITTWYGGFKPGVVATGLSLLAIDCYLIPPIGQLHFESVTDLLRLLLFALVSLIITTLSSNLKQSRQTVEQLNRQLLRESSDQLRSALHAAQMGLWEHNLATGTVTWSPEHEQLFGLAPGAFDGRMETFVACLHPDDRERVMQVSNQAVQNHVAFLFECRVVWADGSIHWIEGRGSALYDAAGKPIRISGTAMAIDQRKQAEASLQEQESLLRLFAQYAPAGVAMFDREMRYVMASQRWVDEYNLGSIEPLVNRSHYEIFPEISDRWRQIHARCLAGAIEKCENDSFLRADGSTQWISWEVRPWYRATGDIGGIIIFSVDVTQRNQAEVAIQQSEARLRLAQVSSNSGVWDWDITNNDLYWSPEYYQLYGLAPEAATAYDNWLNCIYPADREAAAQATQNALLDASTELRTEFRVLRQGELRWFAGIGQVFRDPTGQPTRMIGITIDITRQKQNELELQRFNEELEKRVNERTLELQRTHDLLNNFFNAASSAQIGLSIHDPDLRFVQINEALAVVNGLPVEAHLGKTPSEILPELAQIVNPLLHQVMATGQPILNLEIAAAVQSQIGVLRYWLASYFPILSRHGAGQTEGVGVIVVEISDRKQIETTLQLQTQQKQLLWRITQSIRQSLDLKTILNTAVAETRQLLQVDRVAVYRFNPNWSGDFIVESVAEGWVRLVEPDACKVWEDTYLQETQGGRFQNHEILAITDIYQADLQPCHIELLEQFQAYAYAVAPIFVGEVLWGLFATYHNAAPHTWETGEIDLLQNITNQLAIAIQQAELYNQLQVELQERKQTEAVLREAERRWRSLLDNVQLIVVGLDQRGQVNYVNPFFLSLTGYQEAEVLGKNWFTHFLPEHQRSTLPANFSEILTLHLQPYHQNTILTQSGEERCVAWNNTLLRGFDGTPIGTISIGEDVTERQKIETIKNEFIGIVSHELRTPLTSIQMTLGLLKSGIYASKPEKGQRMIEIAMLETNRLVNLVNDILDLERLESGRMVMEKTSCWAGDLMQQAANGLQTISTQQQIRLVLNPTEVAVWASPDMVVQTLTNLLSNAIKFSPPGSVITLGAERQIDEALFQVKDQGRGIPIDKLETIFGRFQQVDASDSREKGGTGLGLPICRSIVERHGGKIWAESTLGEGSTFFFTLPLPPA